MTVKVSPKYQIVIPEKVRKALGIKPGMQVGVIAKGGIAYLVPVRNLKEIQSKLVGKFTAQDLKGLREKKDRKV
ncbi:MAG: AbrB/MazE/SpoVT family DNA-binding domain-containing protein [Bdellovibrionota bacterium]